FHDAKRETAAGPPSFPSSETSPSSSSTEETPVALLKAQSRAARLSARLEAPGSAPSSEQAAQNRLGSLQLEREGAMPSPARCEAVQRATVGCFSPEGASMMREVESR